MFPSQVGSYWLLVQLTNSPPAFVYVLGKKCGLFLALVKESLEIAGGPLSSSLSSDRPTKGVSTGHLYLEIK